MALKLRAAWDVNADLVRLELGIVELLDGVLHVLVAHELHHASAIMEDIRVADVSGLAHVVLQVLPAASGWKTCVDHQQHQHIPDMMNDAAQSRPDMPIQT